MNNEIPRLEYTFHGEYSSGDASRIEGVIESTGFIIANLLGNAKLLSFTSMDSIQEELKNQSKQYKYLLRIRSGNMFHVFYTNSDEYCDEVNRLGQSMEEIIEIEIKAHISISNYSIGSFDYNELLQGIFREASINGIPLLFNSDKGIVSINVPVRGNTDDVKSHYCDQINKALTCLSVYGDFGIWIKRFSFSEKKRNGFGIEFGEKMRIVNEFNANQLNGMLQKVQQDTGYFDVLKKIVESNNAQTQYGKFVPLYLALLDTFYTDNQSIKLLDKQCKKRLSKCLKDNGIDDDKIQRIMSALGKMKSQTEDELLSQAINSYVSVNSTTPKSIHDLRDLRNQLSHENTKSKLSEQKFQELYKHTKSILLEYWEIPLAK